MTHGGGAGRRGRRPGAGPVGTIDPMRSDLPPLALRAAAGWTWRILVVAAGVYALLLLLSTFEVLVVPVLVALLLVALLKPLVDLLEARARLPRGPASVLAILIALGVVAGLVALIGQSVATGFPDLERQARQGWQKLQDELATGPLHLSADQVGNVVDQASQAASTNRDRLISGAVRAGATALDIGAGFFIVLFTTFFFLSGGHGIWQWVVGLFPRTARPRLQGAGERAWSTLTSYVRATVVVAVVDGAGVGVVAAILGVPLALPLGVLVFLGAFVPVVGALVTGIVAVLVALVAKGFFVAALMLAGVIAVQQVESHVLQPFLMGHAVRVHPLAVILSIGAGVLLAGIVGGLFAVPLAAIVNVVGRYLASGEGTTAPPGSPSGPEESAEEAGTLADSASDGPSPGPPGEPAGQPA